MPTSAEATLRKLRKEKEERERARGKENRDDDVKVRLVRDFEGKKEEPQNRSKVAVSRTKKMKDDDVLAMPSASAKDLRLNSIRVLEAKVASARSDLGKVEDDEKGMEMAVARLNKELSEEETRALREASAKMVNVDREEEMFSRLQELDVSVSEFAVKAEKKERKIKKRDPVPRLEDYHTPYQGEDVPVFVGFEYEEVAEAIEAADREAEAGRDEREQEWPYTLLADELERSGLF